MLNVYEEPYGYNENDKEDDDLETQDLVDTKMPPLMVLQWRVNSTRTESCEW